MDLKAIGTRIKKARESNHLTQEQLAEKVNLSSTHISVVERGIKAPKLETFVDIANALGVTSDFLLMDVLDDSQQITAISIEISENLKDLPLKEQKRILKIIQILSDNE
ncbi:helix-turn-helix domain-containing protein [Hungatella effluvii]|uniref:helix-turn-helix domain-containing protein n=1 Tax=Hungatella effluvii TaxID=1096246 RepID=UPI0022E34C50|nr:helix-turn-helix transcriptional regulator [Hungatella effluvii]